MNWSEISKEKHLSIAFLTEHNQHMLWVFVNQYIVLSKEIIETFREKMHFGILATNESFTPTLLHEMKDSSAMDWKVISAVYPFTKELYETYKEYIDMEGLLRNTRKKIEIKEETLPSGEKTYVVTDKTISMEKPKMNLDYNSYCEWIKKK